MHNWSYLKCENIFKQVIWTNNTRSIINLTQSFATIIFCLLVSGTLQAGYRNFEFDRITAEDGLSSNIINAIIQDHKGFIWVGTFEGLNKYDGNRITSYYHSAQDVSTLSDNNILAIAEDSKKRLWVLTPSGLHEYDRIHDRFKRHVYSYLQNSELSINKTSHIVEDLEGFLWFNNFLGDLIRFDPDQQEFKHYNLNNKRVGSIFLDSAGCLWVGTLDNFLNWYDPGSDSFHHVRNVYFQPGHIPQDYIWTIVEDRPGHLLIGTSGGIFGFDISKKTFSQTDIFLHHISSFRNNEIKCLFHENDDYLWIGTWGRGLNLYHRQTGELKNFVVEPNSPHSLSNNDVNAIYKDASGVFWIGTQDGLNIIDPAKGMFLHYQNDPNDNNSLSLNFITSFCEDSHSRIWIGTYGDGLNVFNPKTASFFHIKHNPWNSNSLVNDAVRAICEDEHGFLWIGTMKGLNRYDQITGDFLLFQYEEGNPNSIGGDDILAVQEGLGGDIWVGTYGDGFSRLEAINPVEGIYRITTYRHEPGSSNTLSSDYVRSIYVDNEGIVWIGTLGGGLDTYDPVSGTFRNFSVDESEPHSLSNNNINHINEDRQGRIWITTWNGIDMYDRRSEKFYHYGLSHGLPDKMVCDIQEDTFGYFWVSTFRGLSRFDPGGDPEFINFNTNYGLQGSKFNINASLIARDGTMYFGGTNGFNVFHPAEITINDYIPEVVFTNVMINNSKVAIGKRERGLVHLKSAISEASSIMLYYKARTVSFEFAALSFSMSEKNRYAYMLEGYDDGWTEVGSRDNRVIYNNLPPGEYKFLVKASNNGGIWSDVPSELLIKVMPPPWLTWWAIVLYFLIIMGLLYMARSITLTQAGLRHDLKLQQIERENVEKINDIKLRFFTNISHEFKTPLTLILGPLQRLLTDHSIHEKARKQLHLVDRNSKRLLYLVNQLMDFRKMETENFRLSVSEGDIIKTLTAVKEAFNEYAIENQIQFDIISNVRSKQILFDKEKFEKIMFNILSNAFKFTPDNGLIQILLFDPEGGETLEDFMGRNQIQMSQFVFNTIDGVDKQKEYLYISVVDSGVGMSNEKIRKIFERFYQIKESSPLRYSVSHTGTGIGLSLALQMVELHHGQIKVYSEKDKGTCFTIALPLCPECYDGEEIIAHTDEQITSEELISIPNVTSDDSETDILDKLDFADIGLSDDEKKTILVVEDNLDIISFLKNNLIQEYKVIEAYDGLQGYQLAVDVLPDLVISDVMMPEMDGNAFCKKLKSDIRTSHIPVILLTAYSSAKSYVEGIEMGADDYIPKPFNIQLLKVRVKNMILGRERLHKVFRNELSVLTEKSALNTLDEKFLRQIISVVEANIDEPDLSVEMLGKEIGMSRTNFFRKLKALTNQTPSEFIRTIKVKKAARLLLEGYNVSEVSYRVGINSRSYFIKCFSEHFGMIPSEFVRKYLKNVSADHTISQK